MLILGYKSDFGTNKPWRFIPKDYKFKYPQNPLFESFPESITVTDLQNDQEHLDFVGVKIGDLNNSIVSTGFATNTERNFESKVIEFLNKKIHKEEAFSIDYTFLESDKILGFQLGLEYQDDLVYDVKVRFNNEEVKHNKFVKIDEDNSRIKFSWNKKNGRASFDDQPISFTISGIAKKDFDASELFRLSNRLCVAEAYNSNLEINNLILKVKQPKSLNNSFNHFCTPNPFYESTHLVMESSHQNTFVLEVYDIAGKRLIYEQIDIRKGSNKVKITLPENDKGIYIYTLKNESENYHGKVIKR